VAPQLAHLAAWLGLATLIVVGRWLCLLAQRMPALVALVRFVRRQVAVRQRQPWSTGPMPPPSGNPPATAPVT